MFKECYSMSTFQTEKHPWSTHSSHPEDALDASEASNCCGVDQWNGSWEGVRAWGEEFLWICTRSLLLNNPDVCLSDLKLNFENWIWIVRTECGITETWIFTKDYIQFQSKRIKFHDITFSFKIIEIQFQTNNSNSNYVIKIQFFKAII